MDTFRAQSFYASQSYNIGTDKLGMVLSIQLKSNSKRYGDRGTLAIEYNNVESNILFPIIISLKGWRVFKTFSKKKTNLEESIIEFSKLDVLEADADNQITLKKEK